MRRVRPVTPPRDAVAPAATKQEPRLMADDEITLKGEPARTLSSLLLQTLTTGAAAMSETVQAFRAAVEANTQATGNLQQAFDSFRSQQQAKLDEALARVETEVAARVQAEADRDAIRSAIEEARTSIEADTAAEQALAAALAGAQPAPTPETPAEPPVAVEPVPETPVETAPVDGVPVTEAPVDAAPVVTPVAEGEPAPTDGAAPAVVPPADGGETAPAV